MNKSAFTQMLKRYVSGSANAEEKALIDHWYELLYNDSMKPLNDEELDAVGQEMWAKIELESNLNKADLIVEKKPVYKLIFKWAAAAAVFAVIVFGINNFFSKKSETVAYEQGKEKNKLTEIINTGKKAETIKLEDGTTVILQQSAKLAYPVHFTTDKREVYLEGEAFFQVTKNPAKPFIVHTGNLLTQVLGTSFTIKPDKKSEKIIVSVKTGKVAVFEDDNVMLKSNNIQKKNNGAIITPNQSVVYDNSNRNFITQLVENPEPVVPEDARDATLLPSFVFDDANLSAVLKSVSKMYAVEIVSENENINKCLFSGDITRQSLYDKLNLICQVTNHSYEIKGTKILIKGKGCE